MSPRPRWRPLLRRLLVVLAVIAASARADGSRFDFRAMFTRKAEAVRAAASHGGWETYFTGYAWHLPYGYDQAVRARLNETTWGGGIGRTIEDEDGDRHSVYVMAFSDSHRALQVNVGYAWQHYWAMTREVSVGAGYLAFLFSRQDVANHLPIPAALPCISLRYRRLEAIGLFVPRVSQDIKGDVLFVYLRVPLGAERSTLKRAGNLTSGPKR